MGSRKCRRTSRNSTCPLDLSTCIQLQSSKSKREIFSTQENPAIFTHYKPQRRSRSFVREPKKMESKYLPHQQFPRREVFLQGAHSEPCDSSATRTVFDTSRTRPSRLPPAEKQFPPKWRKKKSDRQNYSKANSLDHRTKKPTPCSTLPTT